MWISCVLLLTPVLAVASPGSPSPSRIADVVSDVRLHVHSGCVALLVSSTQEISRSVVVLLKLLSARGIAVVTLRIPTLNITHDDANCQHNRPLYVLTQRETLELKKSIASTSPSGPIWLIFSNSSVLLEHLFTDIYIPFDCEFLVARDDPKGGVSLFEVYRVNRTSPLQNILLAVGSQKSGLLWDDKRSLYERRNDLCGSTIKATTYQNSPVVQTIRSTHTLEIDGMFGEVWNTIAKKLNYRTEVRPSEGSSAGALSINGTWNGPIRMLVDQEVDVAVADVTMTSRRVMVVDFSVPLFISRICLFIRRPESSYQALNNILAPFSSELWFALQGAMVILATCLSFAYYVGRRYNIPEKPDLYTLPQALLCVFEIFCQQGHEQTPRTLSCRLIYWVSYMAAVVLFAAFSGALISSLALQRIDPPFTTLSGLLRHGGYSVATLANSAHFNNFDQATDKTMQAIYEKLFDKSMPTGILEGLRNVCWKKNYAFMTTYIQALALGANVNCSIIALKEASLPESLGIAFAKRSPYIQIINLKLLQLRNTGLMNRIRNKAWPIKAEEDKTRWTSVSIDAVTPIFVILSIGIVVATVLMLLERQASKLVQRSSKHYRTSGRRDQEGLRSASP